MHITEPYLGVSKNALKKRKRIKKQHINKMDGIWYFISKNM